MTYSIVARDHQTGHLGVAVASRFFAAGSLVPHIRATSAVATQAFVNPVWGLEAAGRIAGGEEPGAVIADLVSRDAGAAQRQIHAIGSTGRPAAHTGASCIDWAGHVLGEDFSVAGNMLAGPRVVPATAEAYEANRALPLPERLMAAMEAGEAAGGDKRGKQSAALRIHRGEDYPWLDIRSDDHDDPLAELRRLWDVAHERYLHMAEVLPTAANFSGDPDRTGVDAAIAEEARRRADAGVASRSRATPL